MIFPAPTKAGAVQGALFLRPDDPRSKSLTASIDALNRRYGRGTVAYGTATGAKAGRCVPSTCRAPTRRDGGDLLAV